MLSMDVTSTKSLEVSYIGIIAVTIKLEWSFVVKVASCRGTSTFSNAAIVDLKLLI